MTLDHSDRSHAQGDSCGEDAVVVSATLEDILDSAPFRTSKQCQDLLRYVVERSLAQDEESLKERIIGSEVFGRRPDYNTADDPVVRIRAGEVRKRLALYYRTPSHSAKVEIDIPSGSYRARFRSLQATEQAVEAKPQKAEEVLQQEGEPGAVARNSIPSSGAHLAGPASKWIPWPVSLLHFKRPYAIAILSFVFTALLIGELWYRHDASDLFDAFWNPIRLSPKGPIIYVPGNQVYLLLPGHNGKGVAANGLPGDLQGDQTNYVNRGDAAALSSITWTLSGFKKSYDLRFSNDIAVSDIRQSPIILLGAFNNTWTLLLDNRLPLVFMPPSTIQETAGAHQSWTTILDNNGNPSEDYSLVIRELHSKSGGVALTIAGLSMTGTRASAEFVSDPVRMNRALKQLPAGWQRKNVELLLHSNITSDLPTSTDVVAFRVW